MVVNVTLFSQFLPAETENVIVKMTYDSFLEFYHGNEGNNSLNNQSKFS